MLQLIVHPPTAEHKKIKNKEHLDKCMKQNPSNSTTTNVQALTEDVTSQNK